jgi:hypothetical protein
MFKTSDLYLAAFLKTAGVVLTGASLQAGDRPKVLFEFEDPGGMILRELKDEFFLDRAKINALSYSQNIRLLKILLHRTLPKKGETL